LQHYPKDDLIILYIPGKRRDGFPNSLIIIITNRCTKLKLNLGGIEKCGGAIRIGSSRRTASHSVWELNYSYTVV